MSEFTRAMPGDPSRDTLTQLAYQLDMAPRGEVVPEAWYPMLKRQYLAVKRAVDATPTKPSDDAWKSAFGVSRGFRTGVGELVSISLPGYSGELPRAQAIYFHGLMAHFLSPIRERAEVPA
jgi:hypothetical protein